MGYHTHFYACIPEKQVDWAKEILAGYQKVLQKKLDNIPSDEHFKKMYKSTLEMVSDERIKEQREAAKKYEWPQHIIDSNEAFYVKYRDPNYTWESEKREWIGKLTDLKNTGLLDIKFDGDLSLDYVAFLIENWNKFFSLREYGAEESYYQVHDGKLYSGLVFKCYYRVKGRYCQSMWFNSNGIIEMVEDYVDVTRKTKSGRNPKLKLTKEEKHEIEKFFKDYPDCYCWII